MQVAEADRDTGLALLRDRERREDPGGVVEVCARLIDLGEWRIVWELGKRRLAAAKGCRFKPKSARDEEGRILRGADGRIVLQQCGNCGKVYHGLGIPLDAAHKPNPIAAAHAANVLRLLAPVAGLVGDGSPIGNPRRFYDYNHDGITYLGREIVPNPLESYVKALQLWRPNGWFPDRHTGFRGWFKSGWYRLNNTIYCGSMDMHAVIYTDGRVKHGPRCPPLPVVPVEL